ncbi:MAG: RrF2 family transcriptional regulator [Bacteroidales bacterium]|nr:RrF2 family transcriptional regulator [Bacteroidales bacterium]MBP5135327.1 RrF2 family transcriptional regulator [Paludibacteraceae bacterium]MBR6309899.1 RrF2 family transcriptional regulator [Paludibacteraceae bacterium]MDD6358061.1 RrF2 family transcriptional regulator [Bacteroidales bacterium]
MMISTRGRYAIRVIVDLAEQCSSKYVRLKDLSERQGVSIKYLENIMALLSKHGMVDAVHGKGGGYKLTKDPSEYKVGDFLRLTEGTLAPVSCLECGGPDCPKKTNCRTLPMWKKLDKMINDYFDSITIADLMRTEDGMWI